MKKIIVSVLLLLLILPTGAWADKIATVNGVVYDTNSNTGVSGADIVVECDNGETEYGKTGTFGYYNVYIDCPITHGVKVTATKEGIGSAIGEGVIFDAGWQIINEAEVNVGLGIINISIPEFPVALLPAMLTVFGVGLVKRRF